MVDVIRMEVRTEQRFRFDETVYEAKAYVFVNGTRRSKWADAPDIHGIYTPPNEAFALDTFFPFGPTNTLQVPPRTGYGTHTLLTYLKWVERRHVPKTAAFVEPISKPFREMLTRWGSASPQRPTPYETILEGGRSFAKKRYGTLVELVDVSRKTL